MGTVRKVAWSCLVASVVGLVYGLSVGNFFEEGSAIARMPWGLTLLVDVYVGFFLISCWIAWRDNGGSAAFIWIALILALGNIVTAVYMSSTFIHRTMHTDFLRLVHSALLLSATTLLAAPIEAKVLLRVGLAYDLDSGELLYSEHHRDVYDGERVLRSTVTYKDVEGDAFAEKRIDFTAGRTMPDFSLANRRTGHREGSQRAGELLAISHRKVETKKFKTVEVSAPMTGIIDAGFDRFVEDYWDELAGDKIVVRPFLVPSRFDFLDFRIRKLKEDMKFGRRTLVFRMEPNGLLLRTLMVDPIDITYDAQKRILMRYQGISNMRDTKGENYKVWIEFPMDRREVLSDVKCKSNLDPPK